MARAAVKVRKVAKTGPFRWEATLERNPRDWRRNELVQAGLEPELGLEDLVFNWTSKSVTDLYAQGALTAIKLDNSIDGVPTVTIGVRDPDGELFNVRAGRWRAPVTKKTLVVKGRRVPAPPAAVDEGWNPIVPPELIARAMEVSLNGVVFRLVKVSYQHSSGETELTFEHRTVYLLKRKRGEFRASRAQVTRAEFILGLLRQVRLIKPPFICPQLHRKQAVQAQAQTQSAGATPAPDTPSTGGGGFSPNAKITVKHVPATAQQKRDIDAILGEAARMGASRNVMIACVMCTTQESAIQPLSHGDAARNDTIGYFQQGPEWIDPADTKDPAKCVHAFLDGKNANSWRKKYGSLTKVPGGYEQAIKGVQVSIGGYAQWEDEATRTVEQWGGAAGTTEGSATTRLEPSGSASYQFSRNSDEDSWTAITRLAEEVGWRCFLVGNAVYYMSEEDLYARRPRYTVRPDDESVLELSYDVDWGKPTSEAVLNINLDRWGAPVGSIVELEDFGPPDGRWLVTANSRDWFSPTAELTLRQPGKAKLEPPTETKTTSGPAAAAAGEGEGDVGDGSAADKLYNACKQISDKGYPYIWGGGHGTAGNPDAGTNTPSKNSGPPPGYDCSGSTAAALKMAGLAYTSGPADVSGTMAGKWQAGQGKECTIYANGEHVWIGFDKRNDRFDTSPHAGDTSSARGPRLRGKMRSDTGGFTARHIGGM
ncbi:MAG TPA: hypothetical protein VJN72_14280 [Gaiellales bacterium]|nr:hypothetical protein [Gaiellales bacterium]